MDAGLKGFDFKEMAKAKGLIDSDGIFNEKIASEVGISLKSFQEIVGGWNNPQRGKNFNAIANFFKLDPAKLRAFFKWRAELWQDWTDRGMPEDEPEWDYVNDWKGKYYNEEAVAEADPDAQEAAAGFSADEETPETSDDDDGFNL